jgi:hypothetical protein
MIDPRLQNNACGSSALIKFCIFLSRVFFFFFFWPQNNSLRVRWGRTEMEVIPGRSVGPFALGSTIQTVFRILVEGTGLKYETDFLYDEERPFHFDMIFDLKEIGVQLRFDPMTQRLWMVDVYDVGKVTLRYGDRVFADNGAGVPTLPLLYGLFGPTFPGHYDTDLDSYILTYRGLSFAFMIPHHAVKAEEIPMSLPDGSKPLVSRIQVHTGSDLRQIALPPALCRKDNHTQIVLYKNVGTGRCYNFTVQRLGKGAAFFQYNDTAQYVLAELGPPTSIFEKVEDKMKIHRASPTEFDGTVGGGGGRQGCGGSPSRGGKSTLSGDPPDYFLNYFHLGMDVLIDGKYHTVKKCIVHSNVPGQNSFNDYTRCHFQVTVVETERDDFVRVPNPTVLGESPGDASNPVEPPRAPAAPAMEPPTVATGNGEKKKKKKKKKKGSSSPTEKDASGSSPSAPAMGHFGSRIGEGAGSRFCVRVNTLWSEVEHNFGKPAGPMIRADEVEDEAYSFSGRMSAPSPYPASRIYAYHGCVFEILQSNYISNITFFASH